MSAAAAACAIGALMLRSPVLQPHGASATVVEAERTPQADYARLPLGPAKARFAGGTPQNLFLACPQLLDRLPPGLAAATPEDRLASRPVPPPAEAAGRPVTLLTAYAPVVSRSGRHAAALVTSICPGLCGGGWMLRFRRVRGRWEAWGRAEWLWVV